MTKPAMMAVMRPDAASKPELTPKAKARGKATAVTVRPANRSLENFAPLYPENSFCKS